MMVKRGLVKARGPRDLLGLREPAWKLPLKARSRIGSLLDDGTSLVDRLAQLQEQRTDQRDECLEAEIQGTLDRLKDALTKSKEAIVSALACPSLTIAMAEQDLRDVDEALALFDQEVAPDEDPAPRHASTDHGSDEKA